MVNHHTNSKWLREYKNKLHLSDIQKQVLVGTLLGDGSLKISVSGKSARLQVCHSFVHEEYVLWKKEIFKDWVLSGPKYYKVNNSLIFRTVSHPEIYKFFLDFYQNKIKIVPRDILSLLKSNLALAVWFMDDGNGYSNTNAYRLSTYAFGLKGTLLLQKCLYDNFGLNSSLKKDSKGYQIYIPVKNGSASRFRKLTYKYITSDMKYKYRYHWPRRD
ncbi:TPA: hypothetical protein DIU22_03405 [Candidatus Woesebacteria bacterium]|nr:hypothetical protein [Candidatus Woesebacteria bacterium]